MSRVTSTLIWTMLTARARLALDRLRHWRRRPPRPEAGVREPRRTRPRPSPPAGAIALAEPRTRWIRLLGRRD